MRKLYTIIFIIMLVCVAGTAILLILTPDQVPVHYDINGSVDRIGSKYENIIWPVLTVATGVFIMLMAKRERRKAEKSNEKPLLCTGIGVLILFTVLGFYFMIKSLRYVPGGTSAVSADDLNRFISIGIGALMVVLGNIMPKAKRNSVFGLRTKWSMANDAVWQKSQRFSGIVTVIGGFVIIILALFVPGIWNTVVMMAVIAVVVVLSVSASRRYWLEDKEGGR
ncbi:MAG: SdpI family protein [Lachnospiraceae bacterium]|nr:SdpI family protein [Lachnospiraceae bacterium]